MDSELFEVLGDPTRRRIVDELRSGEQAVGDLVDKVDIAQSGVSRHLRILGEAGFVQVRADGQRRLYSLRPEPFQAIDRWIDDYRRLWEDRLDRMGKELGQRQQTRQRTETA
ncbi:MAG: metalloregulator ArsR/SmtB family transcription factor [Acidimicrobiia bacterium]